MPYTPWGSCRPVGIFKFIFGCMTFESYSKKCENLYSVITTDWQLTGIVRKSTKAAYKTLNFRVIINCFRCENSTKLDNKNWNRAKEWVFDNI